MTSVAQQGFASAADPLFIIGTGRCGSTLLHNLLLRHPHVSFFTSLANRHPDEPGYNRLAVTGSGMPGGSLLLRRWPAVEAYVFWDHYFRGFSRPYRDLTAGDAPADCARKLRAATAAFISPRRPRLICKITGWPRIGFLQAVYPNAKFVCVIRDGRATANSLLHVPFWDGWLGPQRWSWGPLSTDQEERWRRHDGSFVALAALEWEILMDAYERARAAMSDRKRLLEVRYETLCADPLRTMCDVLDFAELDRDRAFERSVTARSMRSENERWRRDLTPAQQAVLSDCLHDALARWNYDEAAPAPKLVAA